MNDIATVTERIHAFNENRLKKMTALKYEMMKENVFRFFRGSCHIFYEDLIGHTLPDSPLVWICGDLHLENFGTFKGDNRLVYFDLNDFDEALLAPATFELVRMACSIFLAFDTLKIEEAKALKMAQLFLKEYSATLKNGKAYYIDSRTAQGIVETFLVAVSGRKQKQILHKRTVRKSDRRGLFMKHPRHFRIEKKLKGELMAHMAEWIRTNNDSPYNYEVLDAAFRLAGTGSVGLKRYLFLLKSVNQKEKYILVEMKQAQAPSLQAFVNATQPEWATQAERIVSIQQKMQNIPPALLSHTLFREDAYIIQEMQPTKDSVNFKLIRDRYRDMYQVIGDMGILTASAQIRSSGWKSAATIDSLIAFGEREDWQAPLLEYARHYAASVREDYVEFRETVVV